MTGGFGFIGSNLARALRYLGTHVKFIASVDVNGINKLAGELYHLLYGQVYVLSVTILRLTNTYGLRIVLGKLLGLVDPSANSKERRFIRK